MNLCSLCWPSVSCWDLKEPSVNILFSRGKYLIVLDRRDICGITKISSKMEPSTSWHKNKVIKTNSFYLFFPLCREPLGTIGRFTITPQRHYPLQQPGVSSVGVLPPVKWDGFSKKSILSPRNSPAVLSPVTVKIARPDHHSTPRSLHSYKHF